MNGKPAISKKRKKRDFALFTERGFFRALTFHVARFIDWIDLAISAPFPGFLVF
jgi:hypothetical protein